MKLPSAFASLESLVSVKEQDGQIYFRLARHLGWAVEHPNGLLVAVAVEPAEPDDDWLEQVTLWLASTPGGLDDSLQVSADGVWLVRRHLSSIEPVELEASLSQMLSIARWLATAGTPSAEAVVPTVSQRLA